MRRVGMVVAAVLFVGCGEPVMGSDAGMLDDAATTDAGAVVVCDEGVARCPPYYVPVCGAGTVWQWDGLAMICGTVYDEMGFPGPQRIGDCSAPEPCPDGRSEWCLAPATFEGGTVVCRGNERGE